MNQRECGACRLGPMCGGNGPMVEREKLRRSRVEGFRELTATATIGYSGLLTQLSQELWALKKKEMECERVYREQLELERDTEAPEDWEACGIPAWGTDPGQTRERCLVGGVGK